jgi:hypothetical protein
LRRIRFKTDEGKTLVFLTNNFELPALTIAQLYRCRWQMELFFEWIKQHLRIKAFFGTSENAVKTQVWIAVSVYVLVAIVRKRLSLDASLHETLQILSLTLFETTPLDQLLTLSHLRRFRAAPAPPTRRQPQGVARGRQRRDRAPRDWFVTAFLATRIRP